MGPSERHWTQVKEVFLQEATDKLDLEKRAGVRLWGEKKTVERVF